ncbi:MAG: acyl carrier protein [Candidatus Borkfalkiaceae bacterium]|nr:acyl carrier protein [Christensenellaceae bacterium]
MEVYEKIVSLLSEQLGIDKEKITPESDVVKDLGADSLDVVQMLMAMEEEYGITVSEDDAANLRTVSDIVAILEKK